MIDSQLTIQGALTSTPDTTAPVIKTTNKTFASTEGIPLTLETVTATNAVDVNVAVTKTGMVIQQAFVRYSQ